MAAFLIADVHVSDMKAYAASGYLEAVPRIAAEFGGFYRARGGATEVLEGDFVPSRMVIIEFPDLASLKAFYDSEAYAPYRDIRQKLARSNIIATEGLSEPLAV